MTIKRGDFLVEIHTEEFPPKSLFQLARAFFDEITERLKKNNLDFVEAQFFATPCRLAVFIKQLEAQQKEQLIERRGPAVNAAFDAEGHPTQACVGFARSCGVQPDALMTIKNAQGEWVGFKQHVSGKTVADLLPTIIEQSLMALPIPKRMRWGAGDVQFVRPVHSVVMLYDDKIIPGTILGCETGRLTRGHRFHAPQMLEIKHAADYVSLLETHGFIIADFVSRQKKILAMTTDLLRAVLGEDAYFVADEALINEVTGLVEWPIALLGKFDANFLKLPKEILISAMQDHQRYFPVCQQETQQLMPYFVTISNIQSQDPQRVIHGNERVLRARLSDAAFFYEVDQKESLESRIERLKGIIFQAKLGTLFDKAKRLSQLAGFIAQQLNIDVSLAERAGWLAKTDLTTNMVNEFPELQGVMGYYYALHDGENKEVALALKEQYMPRFAGDELPSHPIGQVLALADRIDTLVGAFGIEQIPTGDKDPYGLRRAALGVLRMLIENEMNLQLPDVLQLAVSSYGDSCRNTQTIPQLLTFMQERLRAWYLEQGMAADIFAAVAALGVTNPLDTHKRMKAVQSFKKMTEAEALSIANKRVSHILAKYEDVLDAKNINPNFFEEAAEKELAKQLEKKSDLIAKLSQSGQYDEVLLQLAELRQPVDDFFDQVMVMTEDKSRRENRILLLSQLRKLFLKVADIALLQ